MGLKLKKMPEVPAFFNKTLLKLLVLPFFISLVMLILYMTGVFSLLEAKSYDYRVTTFAKSSPPSEDIILIVLDQQSLDWAAQEKGWSFPLPRSVWASLLHFMQDAGAKTVVFDILFSEPSPWGSSDDAIFAQASQDFGAVIQTVYFNNHAGTVSSWNPAISTPQLQTENFILLEKAQNTFIQFPILSLAQSAAALGSVTQTTDSDGITRHADIFYPFKDYSVPSLSLAAFIVGEHIEQAHITYRKKARSAFFGDIRIPTNPQGKTLLRFRGDLDAYVPYNVAQIVQSSESIQAGEQPLLEPELFKDKYIFIGYYAPGLFDICATPISTTYAGVGIHLTMLDNLLSGDFISEIPPIPIYLYIILAVFAASTIVFKSNKIRSVIAALCLYCTLITIIACAGYILGWWIPFVAPLVSVIASFFVCFLYHYVTEGRQKQYLKTAFRHYLSPVVIEQLIAHPERLKLGGERRKISIFFSDLEGFTSISEKLSPEELTTVLNEYLSAMTDIILSSGGTIDKYEGDAIIAFWNAPAEIDQHEQCALQAAIDCQNQLAQMRPYFYEKTGTMLHMRIGLNTGFAVVGNLGSRQRFDYTMIGDSVNLAARLEGLNKQFGTYTLCTDATHKAGVSHIHFREIARVVVMGKKEPVTIFEPMTRAMYEEKTAVLLIFDKAREFFYAGDVVQAVFLFDSISKHDKTAFFYAQKCRALLAENSIAFDGIWQASSK